MYNDNSTITPKYHRLLCQIFGFECLTDLMQYFTIEEMLLLRCTSQAFNEAVLFTLQQKLQPLENYLNSQISYHLDQHNFKCSLLDQIPRIMREFIIRHPY